MFNSEIGEKQGYATEKYNYTGLPLGFPVSIMLIILIFRINIYPYIILLCVKLGLYTIESHSFSVSNLWNNA